MQPPVSYVGEHVFPIKIPTPFDVGPVYSYLIKDEKIVLVDCGQYEERAYLKVKNILNKQGLSLQDIDEIWLTHGHPDHFGQAARLADISGATVYGHRKERSNFTGQNDRTLFADFFASHSVPENLIQEMVNQLDWLQQFQLSVSPEWIEDGDTFSSGKLQFEIKHTPGHAAGHVIFVGQGELIFGGDLMLKNITTNALINFDPDTKSRNKSLLQYRDSLRLLKDQSGYLLPGHQEFIDDIQHVAIHHLGEHEHRYANIKKLLQKEPLSLLTLTAKMFPQAMKKGDVFLAISEVIGYLDWGIAVEEIEEIAVKGNLIYRTIL